MAATAMTSSVSPLRLALFLSISLTFLVFAASVPEPLGPVDGALAALVIALMLWSSVDYLEKGHRDLPFLPFALLHFSLLFALPSLWPNESIRAWDSHQPYFRLALLLVLMCALALMLGHALASAGLRRFGRWVSGLMPDASQLTLRSHWLLSGALLVSVIVGVMSNLAIGTDRLGAAGFILSTALDPVFLFSLAAFAYYKGLWPGRGVVFWGLFFVMLGSGALTGQLDPMVKPILIVFMSRLLLVGKFSKWLPIILVLGFIVINPIKTEYRQLLQGSGSLTPANVVSVWWSAWTNMGYGTRPQKASSATQRRVNELAYVANAVEAVPDRVAYAKGYPWRSMVVSFVPRALWEDKPDIRRIYTSEWGVRFGYIDPSEHRLVALNLPLVVDGYWNFGAAGVLFVGLVLGVVLALLRVIADPTRGTTFAFGMSLFVSIHANMSLGASIGDIPFRLILLSLLVVVLNLATSALSLARLGGRQPAL